MLAPFAAVFGVLVAVEDLYLAWFLRTLDVPLVWSVGVPLLLAALALGGAVLVFLGRARGWIVSSAAAVVPLLGLLGLALLFGYLGVGAWMWSSLLMLIGPIGCLALVLRRPVRDWTSPARATRRPGGRPRVRGAS